MTAPLSDRDQVIFYHTPEEKGPETADVRLREPDVQLAPVEPAAPQSGRLLRAFYDTKTNRTFTLAVTKGTSKRYLALPESAWQAMLPDLCAMHGLNAPKTIIDLSTRWIVAIDDEDGNKMEVRQIDRNQEPNRFIALTCIRDYLVQNRYAEVPSESISDGYDLRPAARTTFAARQARAIDNDELRESINRISQCKKKFTNWTAGVANDNLSTRITTLRDTLKDARTKLETEKTGIEQQLRGSARDNFRQVEALNCELATITERFLALEHTTEIYWASALLRYPYNHKTETDWKVPLRMAFDAKRILLDYFTKNAQQPICNKDMKELERRSTDIAALLIPPTLGNESQVQSGEAVLRLFYAGGDTLSDFVRPTSSAEVAANEPVISFDADPSMEINIPTFTAIAPPQAAGHIYLRKVLAQFHTNQMEPQSLLSGHEIFP